MTILCSTTLAQRETVLCIDAPQVVSLSPVDLIAQEKNLTYLLERLAKAEEPIQQQSWEDSLASWQALMDLLPKMNSKRGVAVLEAIFSDSAVLDAM